MHPFWLKIIRYRPIAWALVTALLLTILVPAHYHLHHLHDAEPAAHTHVLDLHLIADNSGHAHHQQDTSIFSATPDVIVKADKSVFAQFIPLAIFLILLLTLAYHVRLLLDPADGRPVRHSRYYSPPLRAPPPR